jgi:hypothetical protein
MKTFTFAALLAIAAAATGRQIHTKELEYGFCEGASQPFTIDEVILEPYPIVVETGSVINTVVSITLNEPIPVGVTVSFKIIKDLPAGLPLPCVLLGDNYYGSW